MIALYDRGTIMMKNFILIIAIFVVCHFFQPINAQTEGKKQIVPGEQAPPANPGQKNFGGPRPSVGVSQRPAMRQRQCGFVAAGEDHDVGRHEKQREPCEPFGKPEDSPCQSWGERQEEPAADNAQRVERLDR